MISDYLLIAAPLSNLISGNITSKDMVRANSLEKDTLKLVKDIVRGGKPTFKKYTHSIEKISKSLEEDETFDASMQKAERLLSQSDIEAAEIIPRIEQVKNFLRNAYPNSVREDILGTHEGYVSFGENCKFTRVYAAIDDPLNVVAMIPTNSFTAEEVDAIKEVYPDFWEFVTRAITDELINFSADGNELVGYTASIGIKRILGVNPSKPDVAPESQTSSRPSPIKTGNVENINLGKRAFEGNAEQL